MSSLVGDMLSIEVLLEYLDHTCVNLLCDTYWLMSAGINPALFITKYSHYIKGVHLRDAKLIYRWGRFKLVNVPLGKGNLDIRSIIQADCDDIRFYSLEQDSQSPIEDLLYSYQYVKAQTEALNSSLII